MAINPKSLANLQPGNHTGYKKKLTKKLQSELVDYLSDNFQIFIEKMEELSPKEYVNAYIKMAALLLPRSGEIEVSADSPLQWVINPISAKK